MKNSSEYGLRLKRLCNRVRRSGGAATATKPQSVINELVLACLSAHTTETKARTALNKLRHDFVDFNEMRVSRPDEITEVLAKNFRQGKDVSKQIVLLLKEVFDRQDTLDLENLREIGKRDARVFFESLEHTTDYVVARVMLRALEAHAFPVHEQMLVMLRSEEVVDEAADATEVQGFMERQISAKTVHKTYLLLRRHADSFKVPRTAKAKTDKKTVKTSRKKTKSTSKEK